jgi:glycosyltransferase involved in cell wall biosynthesis
MVRKGLRSGPIISVVMPSYNHEKYIADAIHSIISQSVKDLELIVVDDFSMDGSRYIIQSWSDKDSRIKAIFHSKREGIARTVNDGIKNAKGRYIALTASDDMLKQDALEKAIAILDSSEQYGVVILEGECIDNNNRRIGLLFSELHRKPSVQAGCFFRDLVRGNFICTGVIRRSILEKHKIFHNEKLKYLSDWVFWIDLSAVCDFIFLEEPLYYYRIHGTNTVFNLRNMEKDHLEAINIILTKFNELLDNEDKAELLMKKALLYIVLSHRHVEARHLLHQCLGSNLSFINSLKTVLLILLSHFPIIFEYLLHLRNVVYRNVKRSQRIMRRYLS